MFYYVSAILAAFICVISVRISWTYTSKYRHRRAIKTHDALLTGEELEEYARKTAFDHTVSHKATPFYWPIPKMNDNYKFIFSVYKKLNEDIQKQRSTSPAAEWLLDNFYIIEEQVKGLRHNLTKKYYFKLPALTRGPLRGYARIYAVALELLSHTDGRINEEVIINYIKAYQAHNGLTDRELWAMSIMLKIALIENIRYICEKIMETQTQWQKVDELLDNINSESSDNVEKILQAVENQMKFIYEISPSYIEHLSYRLRKIGRPFSIVLQYIEEKLDKRNSSIDEITQKEHTMQAAMKVFIENCIVSLRFISTLDWIDIFESLSEVEQILRNDPDGTYPLMDLASRNYYRNTIEQIAQRSNVSGTHIANEAINLASRQAGADRKLQHVGYYIVDKGVKILEKKIGYAPTIARKIANIVEDNPSAIYIGSTALFSILLTILVMIYTSMAASSFRILLSLLAGIVAIIPISDIVINIVNWVLSHLYKPSILPKLELKQGIPAEYGTMVVIPALLPDAKRTRQLLDHLEVHYSANTEKNLYFALLGDFKDSNTEKADSDDDIIQAALEKVKQLNKKHSRNGNDVFLFAHRHRQYNEKQNKWMGWERKRGALVEFNDILLGSQDTSYSILSFELSELPPIKYVITLDADTILPIDGAKKLIGTMAHPLNTPVIDQNLKIVVNGYGLMQPRIGIEMGSANKSLFSRIFAGDSGIDPYSTATSDIYQDFFDEGIFTGKGIYDLEVFQKVLKTAIPDNSVLSHDLLEGSHVRTGLVTDVEFIDAYPSKYNSYAARLHRWVRGDWQLIPWLFPKVKDRAGNTIKNPLSLISKWKIFDNMRRSIVAPFIMLLIILGFSVLPGNGYYWLSLSMFAITCPLITNAVDYILSKRFAVVIKPKKYVPIISGIQATLFRVLALFIFLPYQAYLMVDAICVTLIRVFITKKNLLEWVTASDAEKRLKNDLKSFWIKMRISIFEALILLIMTYIFKPHLIIAAIILSALWSVSPVIAYLISRTVKNEPDTLSSQDIIQLRIYARKIWRYFEDFVNAKSHYLPPDNYQEDPPNGVAYRTSPTNIGLSVLSALSARDLGYIGTGKLYEYISNTISTIEKMEKWNGHLFNWYNIRTLHPLKPRYVSTVDSGNFACYLITLKQGLIEYLNKPIVDIAFAKGMQDTINLINSEHNLQYPYPYTLNELSMRTTVSPVAWSNTIDELSAASKEFNAGKSRWKPKLDRMIDSFKNELNEFLPWVNAIKNIHNEFNKKVVSEQTSTSSDSCSCDYIHTAFENISQKLNTDIALKDLPIVYRTSASDIKQLIQHIQHNNTDNLELYIEKLNQIESAVNSSAEKVNKFIDAYQNLLKRIDDIAQNIKFTPLYNTKRQLFSIGFDIEENRLTNSYYDLLASEARQTSYLAIAKGEVEQKHWFKLGRTLTLLDRYKGLVSWSGTMFEYLMPLLTMKSYKNTLLDETYHFVVRSQKKYGRQRRVPWGVSESGFYSLDINLDYQYKAFGVPWLGLKRGLIEDIVIAPYATMLALNVDPKSAMENLRRLSVEGLDGLYGFYEAADYTPERLMFENKNSIVKSFMVHHQGMSLLGLNNYINKNTMQNRFHSEPIIKSAELLLQERTPSRLVFTKENKEKIIPFKDVSYTGGDSLRIYDLPDPDLPKTHVLSNGSYSVMITDKGTGYSRNKGLAVTRWREDVTMGNYGMFFFIRNVDTNKIWSSAYAPCNTLPDRYNVVFTSDAAKFSRLDGDIETETEIIVSPTDSAEIRQIKLTNHGQVPHILEVSSYSEVVLMHQNADVSHPAFYNLFVKTEFIPELHTLVAHRRPRTEMQPTIWESHTMTVDAEVVGGIQYETDRMQFIGRGRTIEAPIALEPNKPLSNTVGAVLDPIMSLRQMIKVEPSQTAKISYITSVSETRETVLEVAEKYSFPDAITRAFKLSLTRSRVEAKYLNIKSSEVELYQNLTSHILFISPLQKLKSECVISNTKGQSGLWAYGISGDFPIVLVTLKKTDEIDIVYEILRAHEYWRLKDLRVDIVILNEEANTYSSPLHTLLSNVVNSSCPHDILNKAGGVFVIRCSCVPEEDKNLLCTVARLILKGNGGSLEEQTEQLPINSLPEEKHFNSDIKVYDAPKPYALELYYFNGLGGFRPDGKEYVIKLEQGMQTPLPWTNVISNPEFGFIVTESGGGYIWSENSRENKIVSWSNDPVIDTPGDICYINDTETGELWTITPSPIRENETYAIRHGFGYSIFEHNSHGIEQQMTQFVPVEDTVKICLIKLKNICDTERSLNLTYYIRPVLGVSDQYTAQYIVTKKSPEGALLIQNVFSDDFPGRVAFMDVSENERHVTGNRKEFLGHGTLSNPGGLRQNNLSDTVGSGFDPCGAIQTNITIQPGEEKEVVFLIGSVKQIEQTEQIISKYRNINSCKKSLEQVVKFWNEKLGSVHIYTPDSSIDFLLNGWFMYQVISCRLWARSAFYQSGGAYGFRDQLQDVLSIAHTSPEIARKQILLHSEHQFVEGDVQHWWHQQSNKGVRTRFSDDLLWMPYVTAEYLRITNDWSILNEHRHYIESEPLKEHEDEIYIKPIISQTTGSLYDHCIRAIEKSLNFGDHGLPLMGSGDWNDGMSTVGNKGKGESVWLGWFLYTTLINFVPICRQMNDEERAQKYITAANQLSEAIEMNAWDGNWYRRAYFDDGTPLGSIQNSECKIDAIAQAWAIISGAGNPERIQDAMSSLENYLVKKDEGLIRLLTPPFDGGDLQPGYIKGYVPGVRENGGQYTHAAAWVVLAFAKLGNGDKAYELFELINPLNHSRTQIECSKYKVEPYVSAADVYAAYPHVGRGGWTWYTGSAAWMYKVALEYILGFRKNGNVLVIDPCIPHSWNEYYIFYKYENTKYNIKINNPDGVSKGVKSIWVDGSISSGNCVNLVNDGVEHNVEVYMGKL